MGDCVIKNKYKLNMSLIVINVCGVKYETYLSTINKIPYFADMLANCADSREIFVNRPAHIFKHILAFVIDDLYPFPAKYEQELKFYGVKYDVNSLYMNREFGLMQKKLDDMRNMLDDFQLKSRIQCFKCYKDTGGKSKCPAHENNCIIIGCYRNTEDNYCDYHNNINICKTNLCINPCIDDNVYCFAHQDS
jgi:hypothetical protein